ncbi:MAG: FAD-binding protein [Planctomycetia bacterium]|nr:FAD-binding protein [Planctomycetia bacterium]
MDLERKRIEEDLKGVVSGDVLCDDVGRGLYASDGSLFEVWPLAVVRPRSVDDVAATVRWAAERGVPVHARGAGSSVAGGPLGPGVVIDCSRFMRRIIETRDDTVRVQPGVVASQLDEHLARRRRMFGPDPANAVTTTVGGMIGRDGSGSRFLRHGAVRGRLASVEVVLADGSIVELAPTAAVTDGEPAGAVAALAAGMTVILEESRGTIARFQPKTRATHGGYRLHDLEHDGCIDLPRLICGAEGTLGIVTAATLRTLPANESIAVGLLLFDSLEVAAEAAVSLLPLDPSACDLFDRRHLALARGTKPSFELLIPSVAEAGLLLEFTSDEPAVCNERLDQAMAFAQRGRPGCIDMRRAEDAFDAAFFWELSRNNVSTLHGVRAGMRPVPFLEDIVVPPAALPDFLRRLQEVLKREQATAMLFGHAGQGQLHLRPHAEPRKPGERGRLEALAEAVYAEVVAVGGTIGGEQGLGLSRTPFFHRMFPELSGVFGAVKRLFDPAGILNPGRLAPAIDAAVGGDSWAAFRPAVVLPEAAAGAVEGDPVPSVMPLPVLSWDAARLAVETDACNGCGSCRSLSSSSRTCPRYRENPREEASPRAKANVLAAMLSGALDPKTLSSEAARSLADTCFNCHQCRTDCAAGIDIPALVMELKAAHHAANSIDLGRWLLSRVDGLSATAGRIKPLANWAIANPEARWILEKTLGIARGRKLPPFSGRQFMKWAVRRGITRPSRRSGPRVLYFLDTYARWHDPLLAQSFVSVLERNGIGVFVDPRQVASGMPLVSEGDVDGARRLARRNVRILAEAVRLGYRIVCTEPSTVTCITHDYPLLLDDEDMPRVAAATCDAMTFLWELHREGKLRLDFRPVASRLLYHAPCHSRIGAGMTPAEHLLRLIPGLALEAADRGCSGMAGMFGLSREHYRTSLRVGLGLVSAMRGGGVEAGATECSSCRIQMEQGTTKPVVHPVKLLARGYGLLDGPGPHGLDGLLSATSGRLTTT